MMSVLGCILAGCADIRGVSANLAPVTAGSLDPHQADDAQSRVITLASDLHLQPSVGFDRTLRKGTEWSLTGSLPQGEVYRPRNTVFTLEDINVHEAYLVLSGGRIVGYYLPAEHSYVAEQRPVSISLQ
jgi:hypothetical protein